MNNIFPKCTLTIILVACCFFNQAGAQTVANLVATGSNVKW